MPPLIGSIFFSTQKEMQISREGGRQRQKEREEEGLKTVRSRDLGRVMIHKGACFVNFWGDSKIRKEREFELRWRGFRFGCEMTLSAPVNVRGCGCILVISGWKKHVTVR